MKLHGHAVIPSLDGLRAVSILIVFLAHARVSTYLPGGFGVTVFFFLSGFLITTLFYREAERHGRIDLKAFYIRRLLRLSPPLFVTLAVVYTLVALGIFRGRIDPLAITSQTFYFFNYYATLVPGATEGARGLGVLWSLSVEEHFYLIYPWIFVLLLAGRLRVGHLWLILGAILVWRAIRLMVLGGAPIDIYMSTDTRLDSILYGAVLASMNAQGISARVFPDTPVRRNLLLAGACLVLGGSLLWRAPAFSETLGYSLQGLALMPIFHYAVSRPDLPVFRPLNWDWMRLLGFYSYTIYLAHKVVLSNLHGQFPGVPPLVQAFAAGAVCLLYAVVLNRYIEQPVRRLRYRLEPVGT